ncbi:MAG: O-methyltransferase [Anaerolineales bacterium]|nr:O-methyltransferase [Anaerolineales bacterium]
MFHSIRPAILDRMRFLEEIDRRDRADGTPRLARLRQIPPETGRFIALLAAASPAGSWLEIGTSAGYSTMWLALACEQTGRTLTTFELLPEKILLARETIRLAGIEGVVDLVEGDARECLRGYPRVAFCFLDAEKEVYGDCYDAVVPNLAPGGILAADNAVSHEAALQPMLEKVMADARMDSVIVPIGKGVLLSRKR